MKRVLLIILGVGVSIFIGIVGGFFWAKRKVTFSPLDINEKEPFDFVTSLKEKKEKINEKIKRMRTDDLIDSINRDYK